MKPSCSIRRTAILPALCLAGLMLAGCAGANPNFSVTPEYSGGVQPVADARQPIAVRVVDRRLDVEPRRQGDGEVLTQGDIGTIWSDGSVPSALDASLERAFRDAGFAVQPDAPVVVEAALQRFHLDAQQFTHTNLNSEQGSTLDAVRVLIPRATRPTRAEALLNLSIRKHDRAFGYNHQIGEQARRESKDRGVVKMTLDELVTRVANQAVAKASPDIEQVAQLPVSDEELRGAMAEIEAERTKLSETRQALRDQAAELEASRESLDDLRASLENEDRQRQRELDEREAELSAAKKQLDASMAVQRQRQAELDERLGDLQRRQEQLAGTTADTDEARAQLADRQAELDREARAIEAARTEAARERAMLAARAQELEAASDQNAAQQQALERRRAEVGERERNLEQQAEKLAAEAEAVRQQQDKLSLRSANLSEKERELRDWERRLAEADVDEPLTPPAKQVIADKPPTVIISQPLQAELETTLEALAVRGAVLDDNSVVQAAFLVNDEPVRARTAPAATRRYENRFVVPAPSDLEGRLRSIGGGDFSMTVPLRMGDNVVQVIAWDNQGQRTEETIRVRRVLAPPDGEAHIVAIGINDYENVPPLRFASSDAREIASSFGRGLKTANVTTLLDRDATLEQLKRTLGRDLRSRVAPKDTVVLYFSGHGAPDVVANARGRDDGFEPYLLPVGADPADLYATALPMREIARLIDRLNTERVIFMLDTCYAGGAQRVPGGRGIRVADTRQFQVRAVDPRLAETHRVILTASKENQVSQEKDELGHGVFTYYVLQAIGGDADANDDRIVTVGELYSYVSEHVSKETAGAQTPVLTPQAGVENVAVAFLE